MEHSTQRHQYILLVIEEQIVWLNLKIKGNNLNPPAGSYLYLKKGIVVCPWIQMCG